MFGLFLEQLALNGSDSKTPRLFSKGAWFFYRALASFLLVAKVGGCSPEDFAPGEIFLSILGEKVVVAEPQQANPPRPCEEQNLLSNRQVLPVGERMPPGSQA